MWYDMRWWRPALPSPTCVSFGLSDGCYVCVVFLLSFGVVLVLFDRLIEWNIMWMMEKEMCDCCYAMPCYVMLCYAMNWNSDLIRRISKLVRIISAIIPCALNKSTLLLNFSEEIPITGIISIYYYNTTLKRIKTLRFYFFTYFTR